jgi:AcrR family transcriptional regulator
MGRPAAHDADQLLDVAAELFAQGGARALTMAAVARAAGAASGSVYHRFPDRASLLAALWLRTVSRFQQGYREAIGEQPTPDDVVAAGAWVVTWCRDHLPEAIILQAGARAFDPDTWSTANRKALAENDAEVRKFGRRTVETIATEAQRPRDQVAFTVFELPLAVMRSSLRAGRRPPARDVDLVRGLTAAFIY